jgi:hypothetical protein
VTGSGTGTISPGATLEFQSAVGSSKTPTVFQTIDFTATAAGGVLDLLDPKGFYGEISHFQRTDPLTTDTIKLKGDWSVVGFSENIGGTLGTLTLANGVAQYAFSFIGDYTASDFAIASGKTTTTITHT